MGSCGRYYIRGSSLSLPRPNTVRLTHDTTRRGRRRRYRGRPPACQPAPAGRHFARAPLATRQPTRRREQVHTGHARRPAAQPSTWDKCAENRYMALATAQSARTVARWRLRARAVCQHTRGSNAVAGEWMRGRAADVQAGALDECCREQRREVANGGGADAGAVCLRCTARAAAQAQRSAGAMAERERETRWSNTCALSIDISMMFCSARQLRTAGSKASARKVRVCARTRGCASAFHWCSGLFA